MGSILCAQHILERDTMNIQTLWCENHLKDGGDKIMLTLSQSSRCVKTELAETHIWQSMCEVELSSHCATRQYYTYCLYSVYHALAQNTMPEHMQNSTHSSITTSFLTRTTFTPLHLLLFLLPPVCLLTSPLYCHSSPPFLLVLECVTLKHKLTSVSFHWYGFER
jgi:hypothetical protein